MNSRWLTRAARPASSSCSATCTTALAVGERLVSLADFLEDTLLKSFGVVLSYDLGSGLNIERGGEIVAKWKGAELKQQMREPLQAVQWIDRYLRYLGNLRALGSNEKTPNVAVILRSVDHIVPADGAGFEHGSITSMLRAWSCDSPFADLPFTSLLIADNLNDVEPLIASTAQTVRTRVPLPDAAALEQALDILRKQSPKAFAADANLRADRRDAHGRHRIEPRKPHAHPPPREQAARRRRPGQAQERAGGARLRGPGGIHRSASARSTTTTARKRSRPGCARTSRCGAPAISRRCPWAIYSAARWARARPSSSSASPVKPACRWSSSRISAIAGWARPKAISRRSSGSSARSAAAWCSSTRPTRRSANATRARTTRASRAASIR